MSLLSLAELNRVEMLQLSKERELSDPDPDMWRWSPLEIEEFARMLNVARQAAMDGLRRLTLMEAGSGIGTKLYLAQYHFGMSAYGYEINDEYIELAKDLNVNTVKCDLREEHPKWEDADIVYIARPFKDDAFEVSWELEVMRRMRPGRVLISAYAAVKPYDWFCIYRAPFRGVWVKPKKQNLDRVEITTDEDAVLASTRTPVYNAMIHRTTTGSDPLVPEP